MTISKKKKGKLWTKVLSVADLRRAIRMLKRQDKINLVRAKQMAQRIDNVVDYAKKIISARLEKYFDVQGRLDPTRFGMDLWLTMRSQTHRDIMRVMVRLNDEPYVRDNVRMIEHFAVEMADRLVDDLFVWIDIARQRLSFTQILKLRNIEQRMAALKIFGIERLLSEAKAELIS